MTPAPEPIIREKIEELLRFLPLFDVPGRDFVVDWRGDETRPDGSITLPYPVYAQDVEAFYRLAGQSCWSDTAYVPEQARRMLEDEAAIRRATLDQIRTMLTYCVRGERFCDGHWAAMLESGRVVAILRRLQVLRGSLD
jgi:hypothetical protein